MSTAATQAPVIPLRPGSSQEKASLPLVPPRPNKSRVDRSVSPNPARFAPSPLNEHPHEKKRRGSRLSIDNTNIGEQLARSTSVDLPSLGQEGQEYAGLAEQASSAGEQPSHPEQTATVAEDLKLHAPMPSLPALSAKQRVLAVTRTDSDKAASFGIGRPSSRGEATPAAGSARSLKKKASIASQLSTATESQTEDEHGIPEIGQQVPMYPGAGDVQAPSPVPGSVEAPKPKHHTRKISSRGFPPGSYGLHGHGSAPQDRLEKAYYDKHPDLLKREHTPHHHDRANDFSMSSQDLNRIVRESASRGSGLAVKNYPGCPSDEVGWQAMESTSRGVSPRPVSTEVTVKAESLLKQQLSATPDSEKAGRSDSFASEVIHIDEPVQSHRRSVVVSDGEFSSVEETPILAEDEITKDPSSLDHHPAVELAPEREEPSSRPSSRGHSHSHSRPTSVYKESSFDLHSTPLEDVEEYEPLFPEDDKKAEQKAIEAAKKEKKQRFPSQDVWEDAPSSVHYTAEVSTPELGNGFSTPEPEATSVIPPPRDTETPAQAFARHQEELAEKEAAANGPDGFTPSRNNQKPSWAQHQSHLKGEISNCPGMAHRFPSQDVWEDTPESLQLETTVSKPQDDNDDEVDDAETPIDSKPEVPERPQRKVSETSTDDQPKKPVMPERPKPKQTPSDDAAPTSKPVIPDRPKPHIPARPTKAGPTSGGLEPAEAAAPPRQKPAVPARPVGSKIAALQAGFMSDLNNRLRLGPQAPKKEEIVIEDGPAEKKEKLPLSDARKGRARGPQRRAPAPKNSSPAAALSAEKSTATCTFSTISTTWEIDPEDGEVNAGAVKAEKKIEIPEEEVVPEKPEDEKPVTTTEEQQITEDPVAKEEVRTLATNMAGEPVIEEYEKKSDANGVVKTEAMEN